MMKVEAHMFKGMKRGNHEIRQDGQFLWDAHNIRLTNREDNTFLSITNEKGTSDPLLTLEGHYVGHCVLGKYLVVFTADDNKKVPNNHIYRVERSGNSYTATVLFYKNSQWVGAWSPKYPIEALGFYETELVQKVYWVDGKNQPRVINIVADKLKDIDITEEGNREKIYTEDCFDFVRDLSLSENITVVKESGSGVFSPGTIQYAFSYYNKYGQESNIFYTSELMYISLDNRGGSPEDVSNDTFKITVKNLDSRFQFLRIYSIHRTSIDAVPTVKRITDIEILDSNSIQYTDTGRTGDTEDPTRLLYVGGENIIAGTIAQKDNTLFLGDIELRRKSIPLDIITALRSDAIRNKVTIGQRDVELLKRDDSDSLYEYSNQLALGNVSTFKIGDKYRLGVQFQHESGKWSEPAWVMDYTIPDSKDNRPHINNDKLTIPKISLTLDSSYVKTLINNGYKRIRSLVVLPSIYERMTLAQGVLCPTVFQVKDRVSNTPFAQASWFFRPMVNHSDSYPIQKGSVVQDQHLQALYSGQNRGAEIQNMSTNTFITVNDKAKKDNATNINTFYVDQSIITMHSPDIEFDSSVRQAIDGNEFELKIVGLTQFIANAGDISIKTSSPAPAPNDNGFYHRSMLNINKSSGVPTGLASGMFYKSHIIDEDKSANIFRAYKDTNKDWELNWLIYPWHRSGSLNNDIVRPAGKGTRSAVLKRKVISNIRVSQDNTWLNHSWSATGNGVGQSGITPVSIFNSNEVSLVKIPIPSNSGIEAINYYGNVDSLITSDTEYTFYVAPNEGVTGVPYGDTKAPNPFTRTQLQTVSDNYGGGFVGDYASQLKLVKEPVRMKYKSTPHAVFAFNYQDNNSPVILPTINGSINTVSEEISSVVPFWSKVTVNTPTLTNVTDVQRHHNVTYSGTQSEIETSIVNYLNTYQVVEGTVSGDLAVMQCSTSPTIQSRADLYRYNGTSWAKQHLYSKDNGKIYRYNRYGKDLYWKVKYDGSNYILCQLSMSESDLYSIKQGSVSAPSSKYATLFLAELRRKTEPDNMFGGETEEALRSNMWIPSGKSTPLLVDQNGDGLDTTVEWLWGDTYYQRYDCLKTYPFTQEDENSIVEIASFMCETRVNIDGRYDRNRGQISNLNMSPQNFNLLNMVYSQRDNFFNYRVFDQDYYKQQAFRNQITWSLEKQSGANIDLWTNVTLANTLDMNGDRGKITALKTWNESILCFQEKALNEILFNSRVQIPVSDGVPIEISNGYKVNGKRTFSDTIGCYNKWSIVATPYGLYFPDYNTNSIYLFNGNLTNLSRDNGMDWWVKSSKVNNIWSPLLTGINGENGMRTFYDSKYGDIYFTPGSVSYNITDEKEALCYSELLGQFTSFMSYGGAAAMFNFADGFYSLRADNENNIKLYKNNAGKYNKFYGATMPFSISFISNEEPLLTKIFDTIEIESDVLSNDSLTNKMPFNSISAENEYQKSGINNFEDNPGDIKKKFRVWRINIPRSNKVASKLNNKEDIIRNKYGRSRIRNPWTKITLSNSGEYNEKTILHNIAVKYSI